MPSQNNFHVPHLCGGILFNLLLETRKTRGKIRDRAHGGTDGLSDLDVYIGLVNVVAGNDWKDVDGTTKINVYLTIKGAWTAQVHMFLLLMRFLGKPSIRNTIKKALPSLKGWQGS